MSTPRGLLLLALAASATGCVNLDFAVHNARHCSVVGPETCDGPADSWNLLCVPCEEAYDWEKGYPWQEGTLTAGETVRPIPNDSVTRLTVETEDGLGSLDAYWIPSHGGDDAAAAVTLVYSHGNYANLEHYAPRVRFLYEGGYNLLVWDYRGYGKSQPASTPTAVQWEADALQIRALAETLAPDPSKIVIYGYSLGAIPSVDMAVADPGMALLLESPFTSLHQIAEANAGLSFPGTTLSTGHYENVREIEAYDGPVLIMGGSEDQLFEVKDWEALYDAAPGDPRELWIVDGVGHGIGGGGVPEGGLDAYLSRIAAFLAPLPGAP